MDSQTDQQLVLDLQNGSVDAFEELYHRYKRHIFTFCLMLASDRLLAEDATHDTFLKMRVNINTLNDVCLFRSWLFTIARNGVFRQLHRQQRNGSFNEEDVWTDETPFTLSESRDVAAVMALCIEALKPEYKEGTAVAGV